MIWEINTIHVPRVQHAAFEAAFPAAAAILRTADGCEGVELLRCVEVEGRYQIRVQWRSLADHVDSYPASDVAPRVRALIRPFLCEAEPLHYAIVP